MVSYSARPAQGMNGIPINLTKRLQSIMANLLPSSFCKYSLTEQEATNAAILNTYQKYHIQNLLSEAAEVKLNLKYDPEHHMVFLQQEAEIQGQIGILQLLLALSDEAEDTLKSNRTD